MTDAWTSVGKRVIVVVGKPAIRGRAKTRLAASVGEELATEFYRRCLHDVAGLVAAVCEASSVPATPILAWQDDPEHASYEPFRAAGFALVRQPRGDLGECMLGLANAAFEAGADRVLIVGTDSPTLLPRHFDAAERCLEDGADVVLGPSFDGGYYMIGLSGAHEAVFRDIDWSTDAVVGQTLRRGREAQLLCELTEFWYDVDTLGDLKKMRAHLLEFLQYRHPDLAVETRGLLESLPKGVLEP